MLQPSVAADLVSPKNGSVGHSCDYFKDNCLKQNVFGFVSYDF